MQKALYCVVHWHYVVLLHCFALCQVVLDSYIVLYFLFQNVLVLSGIGRTVFCFICLFFVCLFVCLFVCFRTALFLSNIDRIFFIFFSRTALFYLTSIVLYFFLSFFLSFFISFRTALFYLTSIVFLKKIKKLVLFLFVCLFVSERPCFIWHRSCCVSCFRTGLFYLASVVLCFLFHNGLVLSGIGRVVFPVSERACFIWHRSCCVSCFRTALFYLASVVLCFLFQNGLVLSGIGRIVFPVSERPCFIWHLSYCVSCFRTALFYLASLVVFLLSMYDVSTQCIRDSNSVCQPLKELFSLLTFHSKTPRVLGTGWNLRLCVCVCGGGGGGVINNIVTSQRHRSTTQQRHESPTVTLNCHTNKYKVHKLHHDLSFS